MKVVHVGIVNFSKSIPDLVRLSTIRLSSGFSVNVCILSGTCVEDLRLQPPAEPRGRPERVESVHSDPPWLGLQSVLWAGRQTGNLLQASLTTRHPHRIQSSGLWLTSLDSPEPGLWQEGSSHQPPTVLSSVNIAGFRRQR